MQPVALLCLPAAFFLQSLSLSLLPRSAVAFYMQVTVAQPVIAFSGRRRWAACRLWL